LCPSKNQRQSQNPAWKTSFPAGLLFIAVSLFPPMAERELIFYQGCLALLGRACGAQARAFGASNPSF